MNKFLKLIPLVTSLLLYSTVCLADVDPSRFIRDEEKLKSIFSDKTFNAYHHKHDHEMVRYFAADGKLYEENPKRGYVHGVWSIEDGKICFQWSHGKKKKKCRYVSQSVDQTLIIKHRKKKGDYRVKINLMYPRDGNPHKFE